MTFTERIIGRPAAVRRVLALLILSVAALAIWVLVVLPVEWIVTSQDTWRSEVRVELARSRGNAVRLPRARADLAALPAHPAWAYFYRGAQGQDASTQIQRDISTLCSAAGISPQSLIALPSFDVGQMRSYSVRVSLSASAVQLSQLLVGLRQHTPYLRVERLTASSPQTQQPDQNAPITAVADVVGYSVADSREAGSHT